jgi:hypothetical protein
MREVSIGRAREGQVRLPALESHCRPTRLLERTHALPRDEPFCNRNRRPRSHQYDGRGWDKEAADERNTLMSPISTQRLTCSSAIAVGGRHSKLVGTYMGQTIKHPVAMRGGGDPAYFRKQLKRALLVCEQRTQKQPQVNK